MRKYKIEHFKYYKYKNTPRLLILSGTHGNEAMITRIILKYLQRIQHKLPSFVFIPAVSPDAVRISKRQNSADMDLNRKYFEDNDHPDVNIGMQILNRYKYDLCLDFHMDLFVDSFYLYDSEQMNPHMLDSFRNELTSHKVKLLNGVDDSADPLLNRTFVDGYLVDKEGIPGSVWNWLLDNKIVKRIMTPEIPGKISREKMDFIIKTFFEKVIVLLAHEYERSG